MTLTRRTFLTRVSAAVASLPVLSRFASAAPLGLPLGLQLYSVRQQMNEDLDGALGAVKGAGYTEVEAAAMPKKSATAIRAALDKAGLRCISTHHPFTDLHTRFDELVAFDQALGTKFIICSSPGYRSPASSASNGNTSTAHPLSLDDWQYNAEQFNRMGEQLAAAGITFGYHNHVREFATTEGKVPYKELLRLTDPKKVTMELDCGWAKVAGVDPSDLLRDYPQRFSMLHVKDFRLAATSNPDTHEAKVTELGQGTIDYRPIFAQAAKTQRIQHAFVEQEAFDMPWQQSLQVDAEYLRKLQA